MGHELPMVSAFRQSAYELGLERTPGSLSGKSTQVVKRHSIHNQKKILNKELRKKNTNNGCQTIYYGSNETPIILSGDNTYRPIKYETKKEWNPEDEAPSISLLLRGAFQKVNSNPTRIIF